MQPAYNPDGAKQLHLEIQAVIADSTERS